MLLDLFSDIYKNWQKLTKDFEIPRGYSGSMPTRKRWRQIGGRLFVLAVISALQESRLSINSTFKNARTVFPLFGFFSH
jgi:hypothetical protein